MKKARFFKIGLTDDVYAIFDSRESTLNICCQSLDGNVITLMRIDYISLEDLTFAPSIHIKALDDADEEQYLPKHCASPDRRH